MNDREPSTSSPSSGLESSTSPDVNVFQFMELPQDLVFKLLDMLPLCSLMQVEGASISVLKTVTEFMDRKNSQGWVMLPSYPLHSMNLGPDNPIISHYGNLSAMVAECLVVGCVQGTILLADVRNSLLFFLHNPVSKLVVEMLPPPPPPNAFQHEDDVANAYSYGFGWIGTKSNHNHVIIQLSKWLNDSVDSYCAVFVDKSWKQISFSGRVYVMQDAGTFHDQTKSLYWISTNGTTGIYVILKFSLVDEVLSELPFGNVVGGSPIDSLGVFEGKLCALTKFWKQYEVRVLDERSNNWICRQTIDALCLRRCPFMLLTITNYGKLIMLNTEYTSGRERQFISMYDICTGLLRDIESPITLINIWNRHAAEYEDTIIPVPIQGLCIDCETERNRLVYLATLAEITKRYDEILEPMKAVSNLGVELTTDERKLVAIGLQKAIGARRKAWKAVSNFGHKEESEGHLKMRKDYVQKVEDELTALCKDAISTIDNHLLASSATVESTLCYHKMKCDYFRYMAEYTFGGELKEVLDQLLKAYEDATSAATSVLTPANPIRLGLALKSSVFCYEIMNFRERACSIAKQAYDDAARELEKLDVKLYPNSNLIMSQILDNLTLWTETAD